MVGVEPVIAAWGYEADAAASLTGFALPAVPTPMRLAPVLASAPAVPLRVGWAPWFSALLFGLLLGYWDVPFEDIGKLVARMMLITAGKQIAARAIRG